MASYQKGFFRIGVVLAAPFLVASLGVFAWIAYELSQHWWMTDLVVKKTGLFDDLTPTGPWTTFQVSAHQQDMRPLYAASAGLALTGVLLFLISVSLGWICAGFSRGADHG